MDYIKPFLYFMEGFFTGNVTFNSAQGSEVTATFSGYTAVQSDTLNTVSP